MRKTNDAGLALIKAFEGQELTAYLDPIGKPTVGVGHLILPADHIKIGDVISQERSDDLLRADLHIAEQAVERLITVPLTDNQFAALVSFTFNLGEGSLESSTLHRKLNISDYKGAAAEFPRWNRAGGHVLAGLTRRRLAEQRLFNDEH